MIQLFPDQEDLLVEVRAELSAGIRALLTVAPTGFGKTVLFSYLASRVAARGKRIGILVHREELLDQVSRTLSMFNVRHGVIGAGRGIPRGVNVYAVSVATYVRRLPQAPQFDYLIVDEAHHAIGGSTWGKAIEFNPRAIVLGFTATPQRLSGEGLGQTFQRMVQGPTTADLIALGRLSDYRLLAPARLDTSGLHTRAGDFVRGEAAAAMDKPTITGSAVGHYRRHLNGAPAVAFCVSVEHAHHVAEQFKANGFRSVAVDGRMDREVRRGIMADFARGAINVLTSCDLISEGFDCPGIHGAIMLRPTQSLALYLQQVGRALRVHPGKDRALLLDHVGNWERHGLPDDERQWSLEGAERRPSDSGPSPRQCPTCYAINRAVAVVCVECGKPFPVKTREVEEVDGDLAEVDLEQRRQARNEKLRAQSSARTRDDLVALFRGWGWKDPEYSADKVLAHRALKERRRAGAPL